MLEVTAQVERNSVQLVGAIPTDPPRSDASSLSELERAVVHLSKFDPPSSLAPPGSWRVRVARCFGKKMHNALADPHLEALRRFAITSRLRATDIADDLAALVDAGFSLEQASEAGRLVATMTAEKGGDHVLLVEV